MSDCRTWIDLADFDGNYSVSDKGEIRSNFRIGESGQLVHERILSPAKDKNGYLYINLYKGRKRVTVKVHRLVMKAFCGASKLQVNHINGVKDDNRIENLEYCTAKYNINHAWSAGLCEKNRSAQKENAKKNLAPFNEKTKKTVMQYSLDGACLKVYESISLAAREIGVHRSAIQQCIKGASKTCGGYAWRIAS